MSFRQIAKNSLVPVVTLVALPVLLFAQSDDVNEVTRITVLESGEIQVSGDFVVQLSGASSYRSRGAMGGLDEKPFTLAGDVLIDDSGFTIAAESGRIDPDALVFSDAPTIVVSKTPSTGSFSCDDQSRPRRYYICVE